MRCAKPLRLHLKGNAMIISPEEMQANADARIDFLERAHRGELQMRRHRHRVYLTMAIPCVAVTAFATLVTYGAARFQDAGPVLAGALAAIVFAIAGIACFMAFLAMADDNANFILPEDE